MSGRVCVVAKIVQGVTANRWCCHMTVLKPTATDLERVRVDPAAARGRGYRMQPAPSQASFTTCLVLTMLYR